ncbi:MAG: tRNA (5-methylaminomethyl-2-thiouridylate)-methyltransferase [Chloroflexi bacterium]|nr:tRNA (5-methylaminomethyl-2-thiouridylate)-methyltransferase [Chloroflexota bacterium]
MQKRRILVAMSGGVDSAVAAALLKQVGHEVIGITMNVWPELPDEAVVRADACCSLAAVEDARAVADMLDIPYYVLNLKNIFADRVIDNFYDEYARGRTPNPCVRCNQYIKFDALWPKAQALNCDAIATGHYARILHDARTDRYMLARAVDAQKDQSYVLYTLDNAHLRRTLMPIGERRKEDVRALAREFGLPVADKPESQEICFVHAGEYHDYVGRERPEAMQPGPMVDERGELVGTHKGIGAYTVGQRKGLGLANPEPTFVSRIDPSRNLLVVGPERMLYTHDVVADDLHLTSADSIEPGRQVQAKIRSRAEAAPATVTAREDGSVTVRFDRPQRAVTPGQALVIYDGDVVLGGGTIVSAA